MPAPATVDEFLDLVRKSGVIDDARLNSYLEKQKTAVVPLPPEPGKFATRLVREGVLTFFQAEQILQGKWKRFSIGKYKVLEKLGVGGMGQVFLCEHKLMRRRVAVKVLPASKGDDEASRERFYREARAVAALDHPNIVRAYDVDQDDNLHFIVMEYVDGINFHDLVKKAGPLDPIVACHYIYGAAAGLGYAGGMGIVHRDIKPANILVERSGVVKILDMGLARFFHENEGDDGLTRKFEETVLGTADYLAPEQAIDSHTVDARADLYSLGATFYYLLTGLAPFADGSVAQKLLWHQIREPKPIRELRPEVPAEVAAIVVKLMAKVPANRYQTPGELAAVLAEFVQTPIPPPDAKYIPRLSPAAGGHASAIHRPPSGVMLTGGTPASNTSSSMDLSIPFASPASGPLTAEAASVAAAPAVWADLAADTLTSSGADTKPTPNTTPDVANPKSKSGVRIPAMFAKPYDRKKLTRLLGIVAGGIVLGGMIAYFAGGSRKPPVPVGPGPVVVPTGPRTLYVSKDGKVHPGVTFASIAAAAAKAGPGDTISILDEWHVERPFYLAAVQVRLKDLTIEAGTATKRVHVSLPEEIPSVPHAVIEIAGADGVTVRGLTFDLGGRLDYGMTVTGAAAGVRIEGITITGARSAGIHIHQANGTAERPMLIDRIRVDHIDGGSRVGVLIDSDPRGLTSHVQIVNSRFAGGWAAFQVQGAAQTVEIRNNRVYRCEIGLLCNGGDPATRLKLIGNTFHSLTDAGLKLDAAADAAAEFEVEQNYFARTAVVVKAHQDKWPGLRAKDNARDKPEKGNSSGKPDIKVIEVDGYVLPDFSEDDATFLRPPAGSPLDAVGPYKAKVGAR